MKLIPCPTCQTYAVGQATSQHPQGAPVIVGRFTSQRPLVVKCFRCKKVQRIDVLTFNGLPEMTPDERKSLGGEE